MFSDFFFFICICNEVVCLSGCTGTFAIHSKSFWTHDRLTSPKISLLMSPNMADLPLPHFRGMRFVSFLCIQKDWNGLFHTGDKPLLTHTLHASLKTQMPSSFHCCLFHWTVCDDARHSHIFLTLKMFLLNHNSWHRTAHHQSTCRIYTYVCDLSHARPWTAQPLLRYLCDFVLDENMSIITAVNQTAAAGANQRGQRWLHVSLIKWHEKHLCHYLAALFGLILMDVRVIFARITSEY